MVQTDLEIIKCVLQGCKLIQEPFDSETTQFLHWLSTSKSPLELTKLNSCYRQGDKLGAFNIFTQWKGEFDQLARNQISIEDVAADAEPDDDIFPQTPITVEGEFEPAESNQEKGKRVGIYPITPPSHEAMPQSMFGLPIFTVMKPGTSLEEIDTSVFKNIIEALNLKFDEPELIGVTLDPNIDLKLFRAILSQCRNLDLQDFERRSDETGNIVNPGKVQSYNYTTLFKDAGYSPNTMRSPEFVAKVHTACKRIKQFNMSYRVRKEGSVSDKMKYTPFFSHLEFVIDQHKIEFVGTILIPRLFGDDKTLSLNSKLLARPKGKLEISLLLFLTSLPYGFVAKQHHIPVKKVIFIITLLERCYPNKPSLDLISNNTIINRVIRAMKSLKAKGFISFDEEGVGAKKRYSNIYHYCEMYDHEFESHLKQLESMAPSVPTTLLTYLTEYSFPRKASDESKREFAQVHIPRIFSLFNSNSDSELIQSAKGVYERRLRVIESYADLINHKDTLDVVQRVIELRESK